jgi:hypothetical protein
MVRSRRERCKSSLPARQRPTTPCPHGPRGRAARSGGRARRAWPRLRATSARCASCCTKAATGRSGACARPSGTRCGRSCARGSAPWRSAISGGARSARAPLPAGDARQAVVMVQLLVSSDHTAHGSPGVSADEAGARMAAQRGGCDTTNTGRARHGSSAGGWRGTRGQQGDTAQSRWGCVWSEAWAWAAFARAAAGRGALVRRVLS